MLAAALLFPQLGCDSPTEASQLAIATQALPTAVLGRPLSIPLGAIGGSGGLSWTVSEGSLPVGLTLAGYGEIAGTPGRLGTATFTVRVTDEAGGTATRTFALTVYDEVEITSDFEPMRIGVRYEIGLSAVGGDGAYAWAIVAGALPTGLALEPAAGRLEGTPTEEGERAITLRVRSGDGQTAELAATLVVADGLIITTRALPSGVRWEPFSAALAVSGGAGPYEWSLVGGTLPGGIFLAADGTISGTPVLSRTHVFTVRVTSSDAQSGEATLELAIYEPLEFMGGGETPVTVGTGFSTPLGAFGGDGAYTFAFVGGALPPGVVVNPATGRIEGTPTQVGSFRAEIEVVSGDGQRATGTYEIPVVERTGITTESLPEGTVGVPYTATLTATGGGGGYGWSIASGSLPAGLVMSGAGVISGTPTTEEAATFVVEVWSFAGSAIRALTLRVGR